MWGQRGMLGCPRRISEPTGIGRGRGWPRLRRNGGSGSRRGSSRWPAGCTAIGTGLLAALRSPAYAIRIGERRNRLARFGSGPIAAALTTSGRRLIVREPDAVRDDCQDRIAVLTGFCARL